MMMMIQGLGMGSDWMGIKVVLLHGSNSVPWHGACMDMQGGDGDYSSVAADGGLEGKGKSSSVPSMLYIHWLCNSAWAMVGGLHAGNRKQRRLVMYDPTARFPEPRLFRLQSEQRH